MFYMPEMAGNCASKGLVMTCNCTGCSFPFDESELEAIPTGNKFNRRTGHYCPSCAENKKSKTALNQARTTYHKGLRVRPVHQY